MLHSPSNRVLCIEQAKLIVTGGILDLELILFASVLELLLEALLDGRVVALYKVIVAELDCQGGLAHASRTEQGDLALTGRNGLAGWRSS